MNIFSKTLLLSAIVFVPLQAKGQLPELLIPVSKSEQNVNQGRNDYFIQKNTYFAKRHQIVTVNTDLLNGTDQFNISLFDDVLVVAEVVELDVREGDGVIRWTGRVVDPTYSLDDLIKEGLTKQEAEFALPEITRLNITAAEVAFDESTGLKYQNFFPNFERFKELGQANAALRGAGRSESPSFYDVGMTLGATLSGEYRLMPLASDPRFHLLIEIDPSKVFKPGPIVDPAEPELAEKRRQYREFLDGLGPDPRPTDYHSK